MAVIWIARPAPPSLVLERQARPVVCDRELCGRLLHHDISARFEASRQMVGRDIRGDAIRMVVALPAIEFEREGERLSEFVGVRHGEAVEVVRGGFWGVWHGLSVTGSERTSQEHSARNRSLVTHFLTGPAG
jgi:hypothetical protein